MEKIWRTVVSQFNYVDFKRRFGRFQTLKLTDHFSESRNLIPHQFTICGGSKGKEKQLQEIAVFRHVVFWTRESQKRA